MRIRDDDGAPFAIVVPVVPLFFCDGLKPSLLQAIGCDYDGHHGQTKGSNTVSDRADEDRLDLSSSLERNLLSAVTGDGSDLTR